MSVAYSILGSVYTTLPGHYRFGGRPRSVEESNIPLETDSGVRFVYGQFKRKSFELVFILTDADLDVHKTMYDAIAGELSPFYFSLNGTGSDAVFVRIVPGFDPQERDQPKRTGASSYTRLYDYTLRMTQELV